MLLSTTPAEQSKDGKVRGVNCDMHFVIFNIFEETANKPSNGIRFLRLLTERHRVTFQGDANFLNS